MKINLVSNSIDQSKNNRSVKSNIQFQGKFTSLLTDRFEKLGKKLTEVYNKTSEFINFPCDTFAYKEGDSLVVDTRIIYNGRIRDVLSTKRLSDVDPKSEVALSEMFRINQTTAKMFMDKGPNS